MSIVDKIKSMFQKQNHGLDEVQKPKQLGLQVKLPEMKNFVPLGKAQCKRIYLDDIGARLICILDEVAELLGPTSVITEYVPYR